VPEKYFRNFQKWGTDLNPLSPPGVWVKQKIGQDQQGHGFTHRDDPWNRGNVVAAFDTDLRGFAFDVHRMLGFRDRWNGLHGCPDYNIHTRGDSAQNSTRVI